MPPLYSDIEERPALTRIHLLAALTALAAVLGLALSAGAGAQDLQSQADQKRAKLKQEQSKKGVLSTEISQLSGKIDKLTAEVAKLRNREAVVAAELAEAEEQLRTEQKNLEILRERLDRTIEMLAERLVAIYKADEPDALTVVLESSGFEEILGESEYLARIQDQDSDIVSRVRELRDETRDTVERIRVARDAIAERKAELERTRLALQSREAELQSARDRSQSALSETRGDIHQLEGDISDIEGKIQKQLAAAAAASVPSAPATLPAGPIQGGGSGMIWPVNGPVVSPFGPRWGRLHAGIDIAAPAGTPIRAVQDGSIALLQSDAASGGYGNYTCINHGGGLSSCYAHQSSFAITSGAVQQGDVIGYVGCTGNCFGDHLHFEIRVNGVPTDPFGYL